MKPRFSLKITIEAMVVCAILLCLKVAHGQSSNALRHWISENELTRDELLKVQQYFPNKSSMDLKYAELSFDPSASEFNMTLPDESQTTLFNTRIKEYSSQAKSWRGKTADGKGIATITVNKGMITATISPTPKVSWCILPISKSRHVVYRTNQIKPQPEESAVDYQKMINGDFIPKNKVPRHKEPGEVEGQGMLGNDCYIRILVGFESGIDLIDQTGFAIQCVELSNTIYAQSEINFEAELAFARIYPDNAPLDIEDALSLWEGIFDDQFEDVHSDREHYDADFCILVTNDFDGDYVGLASTILADFSSSFCVVEQGAAINNLSFTHEIGHLMGARHDEYMDGSGDYNHGYILHSEKVRTVMAYNNECEDNGYDCDRIQFFSNPDITYDNTGKTLGISTTAHNERALDENESEFADIEPIVSDKTFLFPEFLDGDIYASVTAINTIHNEADYEITDGASVVWSAASDITMEAGFLAESGSTFQAKLAGCNANRMEDENAATTDDMQNAIAVTVFPNPFSEQFTLSLTSFSEATQLTVKVYDVMGREIFVESINSSLGKNEFTINSHDWIPGVYLLKAFDENALLGIQQLVKQ